MMKVLCHLLIMLAIALNSQGLKSFDELYSDGIDAYWSEDWETSVNLIEEALKSYKLMRNMHKNCSIKCNKVSYTSEAISPAIVYIINKATCLEDCEKEMFGKSAIFSRISTDILEIFKHKRPYIHLQFAYYRLGEFAKSLAATYTYSEYDPDDEMMQRNMDYFRNHENATEEMFVNLEIQPQLAAYDDAIDAYNGEDYEKAAAQFEEALAKYFEAEVECRAMCEGEYDPGPEYPDEVTPFHRQIVDHYRNVLECYMKCPHEIARVSRKSTLPNYLPKHYQFLHYTYHELQLMKQSVECAKAYLLFHPGNQLFKDRISKYDNSDEIPPRQDALKFSERLKKQSALLKYIYDNYGIRDYDGSLLNVYKDADDVPNEEESQNSVQESHVDEESEEEEEGYQSISEKQEDIIATKDDHNERMEMVKQKKNDVDISSLMDSPIGQRTVDSKYVISIVDHSSLSAPPVSEGPLLYQSSVLLANSTQMAGPLRFVVDRFATDVECQQLIDLELSGGILGDGYRGRSSPHTKHELFQGITVHRAAQLAEDGQFPVAPAKLYYEISEKVRLQVKAYFKLEKELYFDYTHLVCRTALKDEMLREDNSHPVHGDNCILHGDGRCIKEEPAYTWRDYSAIMYLNSNFEGGQFIMTDHTARRVTVEVTPRCGRLVSFCAGKECLHGVKPVTRGRRCAMALWFTLDPSHDEELRYKAKTILDELTSKDEL